MIKTLCAMALLILLAITIPFLTSSTPVSYAAITPSVTVKTSPSPTPGVGMQVAQVEYPLPYPGLLPTSPLYFLKILRDQIIEFLITDPMKKVEFYILQADKKVNMAIFLDQANDDKEAVQALNDAEVLREKSVTLLEELKSQGIAIPGFIMDKLLLSLGKHREVALQFKAEITTIQKLLDRAMSLGKAQ